VKVEYGTNLSHPCDIETSGHVPLAANYVQPYVLVSLFPAYSKFLHSALCVAADCENEKK
jgi:hypothetical protein